MDPVLRRALRKAEISPLSGSEPHAAVALVLCGHDRELLLIRRADDPRDPWSGHMALPGGRHESGDADLLATAIRETFEEVGLSLSDENYLGPLPAARARSRNRSPMWVAPHVFRLPGPAPPTTLNHEVAEVVWVPLLDLADPDRESSVEITHDGSQYRFSAWSVEGRKVWGLTYGIVSLFLELIAEAELGSSAESVSPPSSQPHF
jgi:8-oxo-dGTP pyrophosphatase MutT (NUDIX family)